MGSGGEGAKHLAHRVDAGGDLCSVDINTQFVLSCKFDVFLFLYQVNNLGGIDLRLWSEL